MTDTTMTDTTTTDTTTTISDTTSDTRALDQTPAPTPAPTAPVIDAGEWLRPWPERAADLATRIAPFAAHHDRTATFVEGSFAALRAEGFVSAPVPAELGGGGASFVECGAIVTELAKGCPATAVTLSMHYHLVCTQLWRHHRGMPAEAILRKVAASSLVLVSTGASDWLASSGTATRVDGGYIVSARKSPASGAPTGDVASTTIAWPGAPEGPQVIHCSIPFSAEGVSVERTWDTMGLRGTGSDTVVFENVFVPDASVSLVRPAGVWHPIWDTVLSVAMPMIMAAYLGIAEAAAAEALAVARRRCGEPHLQALAGTLMNRLVAGRDAVAAMLASAEDLHFAPSLDRTAMVLSRKSVAAENLIGSVATAMEICGGAGFATGGIERLYRDVHGALHHPLPPERQRLFTGRVALGCDPVTGA